MKERGSERMRERESESDKMTPNETDPNKKSNKVLSKKEKITIGNTSF